MIIIKPCLSCGRGATVREFSDYYPGLGEVYACEIYCKHCGRSAIGRADTKVGAKKSAVEKWNYPGLSFFEKGGALPFV